MIDDANANHWHLDKRVPIALIVTIMLQCGAGIWWGATMAARLDNQERRIESLENRGQKMSESFSNMNNQMSRLDERMTAMLESTHRIERLIEDRKVVR